MLGRNIIAHGITKYDKKPSRKTGSLQMTARPIRDLKGVGVCLRGGWLRQFRFALDSVLMLYRFYK